MNGAGFEMSGRTSVPKRPLGYPPPLPQITIDALSQFDAIYLRSKFHFSEVHGSMNATNEIHLLYLHFVFT